MKSVQPIDSTMVPTATSGSPTGKFCAQASQLQQKVQSVFVDNHSTACMDKAKQRLESLQKEAVTARKAFVNDNQRGFKFVVSWLFSSAVRKEAKEGRKAFQALESTIHSQLAWLDIERENQELDPDLSADLTRLADGVTAGPMNMEEKVPFPVGALSRLYRTVGAMIEETGIDGPTHLPLPSMEPQVFQIIQEFTFTFLATARTGQPGEERWNQMFEAIPENLQVEVFRGATALGFDELSAFMEQKIIAQVPLKALLRSTGQAGPQELHLRQRIHEITDKFGLKDLQADLGKDRRFFVNNRTHYEFRDAKLWLSKGSPQSEFSMKEAWENRKDDPHFFELMCPNYSIKELEALEENSPERFVAFLKLLTGTLPIQYQNMREIDLGLPLLSRLEPQIAERYQKQIDELRLPHDPTMKLEVHSEVHGLAAAESVQDRLEKGINAWSLYNGLEFIAPVDDSRWASMKNLNYYIPPQRDGNVTTEEQIAQVAKLPNTRHVILRRLDRELQPGDFLKHFKDLPNLSRIDIQTSDLRMRDLATELPRILQQRPLTIKHVSTFDGNGNLGRMGRLYRRLQHQGIPVSFDGDYTITLLPPDEE